MLKVLKLKTGANKKKITGLERQFEWMKFGTYYSMPDIFINDVLKH